MKRKIAFMICSVLAFLSCRLPASANEKGDVNLDGLISISDAVLLAKEITETTVFQKPISWENADINNDTLVTFLDVRLLLQLISLNTYSPNPTNPPYSINDISYSADAFNYYADKLCTELKTTGDGEYYDFVNGSFLSYESKFFLAMLNEGYIKTEVLREVFSYYSSSDSDRGMSFVADYHFLKKQLNQNIIFADYSCDECPHGKYFDQLINFNIKSFDDVTNSELAKEYNSQDYYYAVINRLYFIINNDKKSGILSDSSPFSQEWKDEWEWEDEFFMMFGYLNYFDYIIGNESLLGQNVSYTNSKYDSKVEDGELTVTVKNTEETISDIHVESIPSLFIKANHTYTLTFDACSTKRSILTVTAKDELKIQSEEKNTYFNNKLILDTVPQHYSLTLTTPESTRLDIIFLLESVGNESFTITINNVQWK